MGPSSRHKSRTTARRKLGRERPWHIVPVVPDWWLKSRSAHDEEALDREAREFLTMNGFLDQREVAGVILIRLTKTGRKICALPASGFATAFRHMLKLSNYKVRGRQQYIGRAWWSKYNPGDTADELARQGNP